MSEMTTPAAGSPAAPPPPPPQTTGQRLGRWAGIIAGIAIGIGGLVKLVTAFTLPACDSTRMADTLRNIYRDQKVEMKGISDIKTVSSSSSEITCTAVVDISGNPQPISYRTYWEGWTAQVAVRANLPLCDSPQTDETLRNIFKGRKVEINGISGFKTVSKSEAENVCTAQVDAPGELATITYRIFRKGDETQVLITDVKSQPK